MEVTVTFSWAKSRQTLRMWPSIGLFSRGLKNDLNPYCKSNSHAKSKKYIYSPDFGVKK